MAVGEWGASTLPKMATKIVISRIASGILGALLR
jgi:hypothetical protein